MYIPGNTKQKSSDTKTLGICYIPILSYMGGIQSQYLFLKNAFSYYISKSQLQDI